MPRSRIRRAISRGGCGWPWPCSSTAMGTVVVVYTAPEPADGRHRARSSERTDTASEPRWVCACGAELPWPSLLWPKARAPHERACPSTEKGTGATGGGKGRGGGCREGGVHGGHQRKGVTGGREGVREREGVSADRVVFATRQGSLPRVTARISAGVGEQVIGWAWARGQSLSVVDAPRPCPDAGWSLTSSSPCNYFEPHHGGSVSSGADRILLRRTLW